MGMTQFDFVLGERYRLVSPLGEGGMASVYIANDERLGRRVAIKVLAAHLVTDPQFVARFQHEAEAAAKLSHPNVVSVYDFGHDGARHYIVMELVSGRNLKEIIVERGPLPPAQILTIMTQVLDGLAYAHDHGLVHRDIKPQNILVTKDGLAKLADFGIAKAADASPATQTAVVLGSAHYLSPEQASGEEVTPQSDIYSAGVVLYELATGDVPFDGSSLLAVASRHINDMPQDPSVINPELPTGFSRVILCALSKDPANRFSSAAEMREAIRLLDEDIPKPVDPGRTEAIPMVPTPQPTRTEIINAQPSVLTYGFWAFVIAILALAMHQSPKVLPPPWTSYFSSSAISVAAAVAGVMAILTLVLGALERLRHRYSIDQYAVAVETGLFARHRDAIPLPAIINLQMHQHPVARFMNIGTIVITTVQIPGQGPMSLSLRDVHHPSTLYDAILQRVGGRKAHYASEMIPDELQ